MGEILGEAGPRVPNVHHHLPDPVAFPGEASLGTEQCELVAGIVDVDAPLLDLEIIKGEFVRDGLLSVVVEVTELLMNFFRRRPHPVDLPDSWGKAGGRVMPLRRPASSVNHKSRKEREEAVRLVTLRFAVLNRLLSEVCCAEHRPAFITLIYLITAV